MKAAFTTFKVNLPTGVIAGGMQISITNVANGAIVAQKMADEGSLTVDFTGLPDGIFTASAGRLDSTGALLGAVVTSDAFTIVNPVTDPTAQYDAPQTITVTLDGTV